jgi:hypothetical protein
MGGCQVIIWKTWPWTIVGNMFGECHIPCMLKASFLDFENKYRILRTMGQYFFSSTCWLRCIVHIDLYKDEVMYVVEKKSQDGSFYNIKLLSQNI